MTGQERMIRAMKRLPIEGHVPHFELVFYLTMEAIGKVHPEHRFYGQWNQMSAIERRLQLEDMADCFIRIAEMYHHDAIFLHENPGTPEVVRALLEIIRERTGNKFFIMMHGDPTFSIPDGNSMMDFTVRMYEDPEGMHDQAKRNLEASIKRAEALQGIDKNVKEIEKYVSEIVAASREDFLNLEVQVGEVYLSQVMSTIQTYYQDKLSTLHTKFLVEDMEECLLKADKDRLVEVLQNMLENAIKYGDGKEIRITLREEEDCKLLSVENTGCSLKEEELPNLFDSFYRGSNSQGVKGSGLGLYICRELMKKMDGEVFTEIRNGSFLVTAVIQKA